MIAIDTYLSTLHHCNASYLQCVMERLNTPTPHLLSELIADLFALTYSYDQLVTNLEFTHWLRKQARPTQPDAQTAGSSSQPFRETFHATEAAKDRYPSEVGGRSCSSSLGEDKIPSFELYHHSIRTHYIVQPNGSDCSGLVTCVAKLYLVPAL